MGNMFNRSLITGLVIFPALLVAAIYAGPMSETDEQVIRDIVNQAINRLNRGDVTAIADYWDDDADYVGVNGTLTKGRVQIQALFSKLTKSGVGQQSASIEQIRFITPELARVDGSWTVTGARGTDGQKLPPIKGRGFELVQKKGGRWRFISTREMVVFKGS